MTENQLEKNDKKSEQDKIEVIEAKFLGELKSLITEFLEDHPTGKPNSPLFINGVWTVQISY